MKTLLLTDADVFAGTERHMLSLAKGLRERGIDARLGCPASSPLADKGCASGIPVVAVEKRGLLDISAVRTLTGLLRRGEVDLIHAHNGRTAWLAALARLLARRGKLITTMHFIEPARSRRQGLARLLGGLVHRVTKSQLAGMIAISDVVKHQAVQRGDLPASKIHRVYNGVPQPVVQCGRHQTRSDLGIDSSTTVFLAATRLQQEKAVGLLLDAADELVKRGESNFQLLIVGRGRDRQRLQSQIEGSALQDCTRLLGFREDVHDLMAAADALVHSAPAEPFGLVLTEAMALGLPVVASDGGAAPEIVLDGKTGLLFKVGDCISLADQLICLMKDQSERTRLGHSGCHRYLNYFQCERMVDETLAVYNVVLEAPTSIYHSSQTGSIANLPTKT